MYQYIHHIFYFIKMDNFKELKKWHTSGHAEPEDGASPSPPKDAEEESHTPDVKRMVVVTPDDSSSSLVHYLQQRYPRVPEWTVETHSRETGLDRKESEVMVEESVVKLKRLFFCR
ncbi:uncharacterized protein LOC111623552 [Centruroides sculpturatus]|uniref:uncharacterized protein LOC111623552 n=1 Tax=Centruroides sculpturatus TaxID=218467 RepID=UPI000C6D578C|nr:uncharacterized protein LOC111623552 [Centruroides sculpturatus]